MSDSLTSQDLEEYLTAHQIDGEVIQLDMHTPTVETAAEAVSVSPEQIVKTLLFVVDGQPVLVIANGPGKIDRRALGAYYGVSRKKVIFADPDTVLELTGYSVGAVPPIGHRQKMNALVDPGVLEQTTIYGGGGSDTALVRISPQVILEHNHAQVLSLQKA